MRIKQEGARTRAQTDRVAAALGLPLGYTNTALADYSQDSPPYAVAELGAEANRIDASRSLPLPGDVRASADALEESSQGSLCFENGRDSIVE